MKVVWVPGQYVVVRGIEAVSDVAKVVEIVVVVVDRFVVVGDYGIVAVVIVEI